ncbi:DUF6414 family protein [Clostridium novyi]|uniref:DUF6414 family protein n=1 Tax=Clostridium novyi TaxID=1542 RepID=UPI0004D75F72|nr:hypothetical protein [Clostridium novyi]KEH89410.1 hypothetical protein Z967_09550 [Clostridium novyi A str. 4540]
MKNDLCIPIYLNEKVVFDLLAIIEDGFSHISEVKTSSSNQNNINGEVNSSLKSSNILSTLFGVTLSAKLNGDLKNIENEENKKEKVHTNVSLFSKLRKTLINEQILKNDFLHKFDINNVTTGDFIEIEGMLKKSPMIETMGTFLEVFNTFLSFAEEPQLGNKKKFKNEKNENKKIFEQMNILYDDLIKTNTIDLLVDVANSDNVKVLLSAQLNHFVNGFESELVDGKYRILGKVIKIIDENDSINLFRKTSFKIFESTVLNNLIESMNNSINSEESDDIGIKIPEIISQITGPGVIVIPIAIYA